MHELSNRHYFELTQLSVDQLLTKFNTHPTKGLTREAVAKNLLVFGKNELSSSKANWLSILLRQVKSSFVYMLVGAAGLSFLLGEAFDAIIIVLFILINTILGFIQEFRSEHAIRLLKKYVVRSSKVIRNGQEVIINSSELVVGDLVLVETGDIIPADIRLITSSDFTVDESVLTGESVPVFKAPSDTKPGSGKEANTALCFSSTGVVSGKAKGVVIGVGKNTEFGKIAKLTSDTIRVSSFEKSLAKFSKFVLYLVFGTLAVVLFFHIFVANRNISVVDLIVFSVALAVGVIPEALPLVTTFCVSRGALVLAKHKIVVKRLSAIEDLGNIQILCSDKTGTLTENKLEVANFALAGQDRVHAALIYCYAAATDLINKKKIQNSSFDLAVYEKLEKLKLLGLCTFTKLAEYPFDPARRRNSALIEHSAKTTLVVRGAFESVIPQCKNISPDLAAKLAEWHKNQGLEGNRVLAIATKPISGTTYKLFEETQNLDLVNLISFSDPIKKTSALAVAHAAKLGVSVKILTGDSKEVAGSVASKVGIVTSADQVIEGNQLVALDHKAFKAAVHAYAVFARVSPDQKYKIIEVLKESKVVGFLGEGINDAPALKIADVAIVVQGASDIAQDAADILLLTKSLDVIVNGISEGRKTYVNTIKYIKATLTSNFGNFYALAFASLTIDYLPMLPLQILLVNLLSDFPMTAISLDRVSDDEVKSPSTYDVKEIILMSTLLGFVSTLFDFVFFGVFKQFGESVLQTYWFMGSILTELLLIFSIRSKALFYKAKSTPSKALIFLTIPAMLLTIYLPFTSLGTSVFNFARPTFRFTALVLAISASYFIATEFMKHIYYKYIHHVD